MQRGLSPLRSPRFRSPVGERISKAERKYNDRELLLLLLFFSFFVAKLNRRPLRDHRRRVPRFPASRSAEFHGIFHEAFAARNVHRRM